MIDIIARIVSVCLCQTIAAGLVVMGFSRIVEASVAYVILLQGGVV